MLTGTQRELAALVALIDKGSHKEAAAAIHISERAFRRRLQSLRDRNDCSTVQLAYWYRRGVWDVDKAA